MTPNNAKSAVADTPQCSGHQDQPLRAWLIKQIYRSIELSHRPINRSRYESFLGAALPAKMRPTIDQVMSAYVSIVSDTVFVSDVPDLYRPEQVTVKWMYMVGPVQWVLPRRLTSNAASNPREQSVAIHDSRSLRIESIWPSGKTESVIQTTSGWLEDALRWKFLGVKVSECRQCPEPQRTDPA